MFSVSAADGIPEHPGVVNVASVPQRSPFRYAGGKTWLVPWIRHWLQQDNHRAHPPELIEPFAGGGIIGLTAAAEGLASHVTLAELDPDIASVWHTVLSGHAEWLARRIVTFDMTATAVKKAVKTAPETERERAFLTILKNRVCYGGVLAAGSGIMKSGDNGKGIAARWYPETLAKRIRAIYTMRHNITFVHGDGLEVIRQHAKHDNAVFFIDPPYTAPGKRAGKRLYNYHELDHAALFDLATTIAGDFIMTYDNAESVRDMAAQRGFAIRAVSMKGNHHKKTTELLISRAQNIVS